MDIRGWPLDRIMQLPDCCFGSRFLVTCSVATGTGGNAHNMSAIALPEWCVLWEIHGSQRKRNVFNANIGFHFILGLRDQVSTNYAQLMESGLLFPHCGYFVTDHYSMTGNIHVTKLKYPIHAGGRRVVTYFVNDGDGDVLQIEMVFSNMPTEVPDWLQHSDHGRSL